MRVTSFSDRNLAFPLTFFAHLQMPGLKAVYREEGPGDPSGSRRRACPARPSALEERFKEINAAYRELHDYLENPRRFQVDRRSFPDQALPVGDADEKDRFVPGVCRFFTGTVPKRTLLFGQYVFYHGFISYRQLIDAIVWQKMRRPLFGSMPGAGDG